MSVELHVDTTNRIRKITRLDGFGTVIKDEPYQPNGKPIFVNPKTGVLEETEPVPRLYGRQRRTNDFLSNGNKTVFHPTKKEFAEIKPTHGWENYDKVRDLPIAC